MAALATDLSSRFATAEVESLRRRFPHVLADNPEAEAMLATALEEAVGIGFDAWSRLHGPPPRGERAEAELWERWRAQRELTPEAESWPARLRREGGALGDAALVEAEERLAEVAAAVGLAGGRGRRAARAFRTAGSQAAEAGASLQVAMRGREGEAAPPVAATAGPAPVAPPLDGAVRVAMAANLAECELLQGMLQNAGIPSTWSRSGADPPHLLAAGYRDVYVPVSAAERARVILSTVESSADDSAETPTRRVGLERTWLRRLGKVGAAWVLFGSLIFALAVVAWSEWT